jgi:hypothetical protein
MATSSVATFRDSGLLARARAAGAAAAHWSIYAVLFASTSVILGAIWDISWHRSIGRDTFWTPAHLAIYLGGVVAGLTSGWVALTNHVCGVRCGSRHRRSFLGVPCAVRRLGLHLGRLRDGHLGAV